MTRFQVLGEVRVGGLPLIVKHKGALITLSLLLLHANEVVRTDTLIDDIWGEQVPRKPVEGLRSHLSRLRAALPDDVALTRRAGGYALEVAPESVDVHHFRLLAAAGQHAEALALWRGEPFAGLRAPGLERARTALRGERLAVALDLNDARLRTGDHALVLASAQELAEEHPADERVARQLMRALADGGRQNDALRTFEILRTRLADELGTDPDQETRRLHQQLLTDSGKPRELPAAPWSFSARTAELAALTDALTSDGPRLVVISGPGGVGKTALALHWAHQNAALFPDGQLYVDLMGFTPAGHPVSPADALQRLLNRLGATTVPDTLDARAALFRSTVADQRVLLVLDNAADAAQITPLLPGTAACAVLITSRDHLHSTTTRGARLVPLATLTSSDGERLLADRIGANRVAAEPDAAAGLIEACAGLPLALAVVAGHVQARPKFPLTAFAEELRDASTRLQALDLGAPETSLTAVLASSHRALDPAHARTFGLLAAVPGEDLSVSFVAALTDRSTVDVRTELRALERVSLAEEHVPGRWRMHDLVRLYGQEHAAPPDLAESLHRLVNFALHSAHAADHVLNTFRRPITLPPAEVEPLSFADTTAALFWFDAEHRTVSALQEVADDEACWRLAWVLNSYYWARSRAHDDVAVNRAGVEAAERLGDQAVLAIAHLMLGQAWESVGECESAEHHLEIAGVHAKEIGDAWRASAVHRTLGKLARRREDYREALEQALLTLDVVRTLDDEAWESDAVTAVGWAAALCGEFGLAEEHLRVGLTMQIAIGDTDGEAHTTDSLGYVLNATGRHEESLPLFHRSIELLRRLGNEQYEARTLDHLGDALHALGQADDARESWRRAEELHRATDRPDLADAVRAKLT
ncbi:BTAD domain-containing putative transcriptional regulator [Lentzea sp. NPDC006480]|uniref:AfsR/SARP family transcriptional regulator n=1 Tax=Lentzea sp. NPDC006480 TaxID=3157176 RepID=UPI0033B5804B